MKSGSSEAAEAFILEEFLPYELSVAANRISRLFARRYSEAFGLSIAQWRVLAVVGRRQALSPRQVADATEMDKVKVSRAASQLVAQGLLSQEPDPQDGRARVLRLTARGREVHRGVVPLARDLEAQIKACMEPTDWAALRPALRRLSGVVAALERSETLASPASRLP
jgi:DNA-binding MarR family transcriptional regulator